MTGFAAGPFLTGLAVSAAVVAATFLVTALAARLLGRWNVVDVTWGLSFAFTAAASFAWSGQVRGVDLTGRALALGLTVGWGGRLAGYIAIRGRGKGEDPRYAEMLDRAPSSRDAYAFRMIILPQAFLSWFVSLPVQITMYERGRLGPLAWIGVFVWALGFFFESVGDAQMAAFRRDPANRGGVMDRGLWRYTRHPNYFGDACVWLGLYLLAADRWPGALTVLSPAAMLYFLYYKSGKGLLEKRMADTRPGYRAYMQRTSGFVPLPPRGR